MYEDFTLDFGLSTPNYSFKKDFVIENYEKHPQIKGIEVAI